MRHLIKNIAVILFAIVVFLSIPIYIGYRSFKNASESNKYFRAEQEGNFLKNVISDYHKATNQIPSNKESPLSLVNKKTKSPENWKQPLAKKIQTILKALRINTGTRVQLPRLLLTFFPLDQTEVKVLMMS